MIVYAPNNIRVLGLVPESIADFCASYGEKNFVIVYGSGSTDDLRYVRDAAGRIRRFGSRAAAEKALKKLVEVE